VDESFATTKKEKERHSNN